MSDEYTERKKNILPVDTTARAPYTSWPGGYTHHLVFLIRYDDANGSIGKMQQELEKAGGFIPFEKDYFHITLKGGGLYHTHEDAMRDAALYRTKKNDIPIGSESFDVRLRGINFFNTVVFVQCFDEGKLVALHRKVLSAYDLEVHPRRDLENYIPHMAIGTYAHPQHTDRLFERGEKYRETDFGTVRMIRERDETCRKMRKSKDESSVL